LLAKNHQKVLHNRVGMGQKHDVRLEVHRNPLHGSRIRTELVIKQDCRLLFDMQSVIFRDDWLRNHLSPAPFLEVSLDGQTLFHSTVSHGL
jgi:hypothetical protein